MMGEAVSWSSVPWVWSDLFDWNLQVAGFPGAGDAVVRRGDPSDGKMLAFALKDGAVVETMTVEQLRAGTPDERYTNQLLVASRGYDRAAIAQFQDFA